MRQWQSYHPALLLKKWMKPNSLLAVLLIFWVGLFLWKMTEEDESRQYRASLQVIQENEQ